jgi:hypothetical protein
LLEISADPKRLGARIGVLAVLHTWGQKLTLHPHLHCIVPGGGLSINGDWWVGSRPDFFLPVRVLEMTLSGEEFLRRFLLHVLPDHFVRIRYYGLLANRHREQSLALCREVLPGPPVPPKLTKSDWQSLLQSLTGVDPMRCEVCGQSALHLLGELTPAQAPRAPPR